MTKKGYEVRSKMPIPLLGEPKKGKGNAFAQGKCCRAMKLHLRLVAFKVLRRVAAIVIWNHLKHFKLRSKRSILDLLCERRLQLLKPRQFSNDLSKLHLELLYVFLHLV